MSPENTTKAPNSVCRQEEFCFGNVGACCSRTVAGTEALWHFVAPSHVNTHSSAFTASTADSALSPEISSASPSSSTSPSISLVSTPSVQPRVRYYFLRRVFVVDLRLKIVHRLPINSVIVG
uniref:Uncharacterized protein n=1 Tax=Timema monikensis TaxID=170555 RepID=A0A7R9EAV9_9NEOP|nr:unnamed protein product [Timema monikensis]